MFQAGTYSHTHADANTDPDTHADADANTDPNAHAKTDTYPNTNRTFRGAGGWGVHFRHGKF